MKKIYDSSLETIVIVEDFVNIIQRATNIGGEWAKWAKHMQGSAFYAATVFNLRPIKSKNIKLSLLEEVNKYEFAVREITETFYPFRDWLKSKPEDEVVGQAQYGNFVLDNFMGDKYYPFYFVYPWMKTFCEILWDKYPDKEKGYLTGEDNVTAKEALTILNKTRRKLNI